MKTSTFAKQPITYISILIMPIYDNQSIKVYQNIQSICNDATSHSPSIDKYDEIT